MRLHYFVMIGFCIWIMSLGGCSNNDDYAQAIVSVTPGTNVTVGSTVLLNASESRYSDDKISWSLNSQPIGECNHRDICSLKMNTAGDQVVTLKVTFSEVKTLGATVVPEDNDEASVIFNVTNP